MRAWCSMVSTSSFQVESQGSNPCVRSNDIKVGDLVTFINAHPLYNKWIGLVVEVNSVYYYMHVKGWEDDEILEKMHWCASYFYNPDFEHKNKENLICVYAPKSIRPGRNFTIIGMHSSNLQKVNILHDK